MPLVPAERRFVPHPSPLHSQGQSHNRACIMQNLCLLHISLTLGPIMFSQYSKTCAKRPLSKRQKIGFQDQLSLNAGQKYCRILQREHSVILSTFIKLPVVIKTFFFLFLGGHFTQVFAVH